MPTADHYAHAIITAARRTGKPPLSIADESPETMFRHYVLHALLQVFPDADRTAISAALGAPGKASYFHRSSMWHVLGDGPHRKGPIEWWDAGVMAEVIRAVETVAVPRPAPTVPPSLPTRANLIAPKPVLRQPVRKVEAHGPPRTGLDRFVDRFGRPGNWHAGGDDQLQGREREKRECRDLLAETAANTAKL